ncbi:DUF4760 domain-containing protein [Streptomyces justiciae]|uniref:DUF4760 domain-containing protein n=1 Tax=Streptomyces justiciae TaxID=2780140 RepID=UPI00187F1613|nr:hypothetical protein [Streptomyces justiciae]MBE8473790.1 hypothetical protein [Streptomyces justiciae]
MDSSVVFNIVTAAIAVVAVVTSVVFGARQARIAKHANHISVMMDLFAEFRSVEFHEQHDYVTTRLGAECDPAGGVRGLPAEPRAAFYSVVYYYQSFANLAVFGLLDETLLATVLRTRIVSVWEAVRPFVERERELRGEAGGGTYMSIFEELARLAADLPPEHVRARLTASRRGRLRGLG